jgi:hypothetical protein
MTERWRAMGADVVWSDADRAYAVYGLRDDGRRYVPCYFRTVDKVEAFMTRPREKP